MSCLQSLKNLFHKVKPGSQPAPQPQPSQASQPAAPTQPTTPSAPSQPAKPSPTQPSTGAPATGNTPGGGDKANAPTTDPASSQPQPQDPPASDAPSTPATINFDLVNQTDGSQPVFAFITGQAINNGNRFFLLQADGRTPYYPDNPSATNAPLAVNCAIALGGAGATTTCTIPQIAGGRIWFSVGQALIFQLNPGPNGPALVEPSALNPSDPSINIRWGFAEFTYNQQQLFANISSVDFVGLPIGLDLYDTNGADQHVGGLPADGIQRIANGLNAQNAADGAGWNKLIVNGPGGVLRVLSPNAANTGGNGVASNYYDAYVNDIWSRYSNTPLQVDTQASFGTVSGTVQNGVLTFDGGATFTKPSTSDIFSCSTGPFSGSSTEQLAITPRLAAAFNRTTLQLNAVQPDGVSPPQYYQTSPTNHYSRILHQTSVDGRGYAFPYDDVVPNGGTDVAGTVFTGIPQRLVVSVGGANAHA
ncbi:MAG: hypothetical protein Q9159_003589 [Coniocarpon cinnabarinum]